MPAMVHHEDMDKAIAILKRAGFDIDYAITQANSHPRGEAFDLIIRGNWKQFNIYLKNPPYEQVRDLIAIDYDVDTNPKREVGEVEAIEIIIQEKLG